MIRGSGDVEVLHPVCINHTFFPQLNEIPDPFLQMFKIRLLDNVTMRNEYCRNEIVDCVNFFACDCKRRNKLPIFSLVQKPCKSKLQGLRMSI